MVNIAEIIKKYQDESNKLSVQKDKSIIQGVAQPHDVCVLSVSAIADKALSGLESIQVSSLYCEVMTGVKQVYSQQTRDTKTISADVLTVVQALSEKIIQFLKIDKNALLIVCLADYPALEDYFYCHIVNVSILALYLGVVFKYEQVRLIELGVAAFLHDLGMLYHWDVINDSKKISSEALDNVKKHPIQAKEILQNNRTILSGRIIEAAYQEHERANGLGYPQGLSNDAINEYARILAVADVYEALMHSRPYRGKYSSLNTIKTMLDSKAQFDQKVIKVLLESIGIFPAGTLVRLNTRESGMVMKNNTRLPLRPLVHVLFDCEGKELVESKHVDLAENTMLFIDECLNDFPTKAG